MIFALQNKKQIDDDEKKEFTPISPIGDRHVCVATAKECLG